MWHLYYLILWLQIITALTLTPPEYGTPMISSIEQTLLRSIQNVPHINIMLRWNTAVQDAESVYIRWFLQQSHCPLTLSLYNDEEPADRTNLDVNRESFVFVTNMQHLHTVAERFVQRAGTYFFVVTDAIVLEELHDIWYTLWSKYSVFQNYLLTVEQILIYDPFEYNLERQRYGTVVGYSGVRSLERTLFDDMRGYPLRIQIFRSVYARPIVEKRTKKLLRVEGVDSKVVKLLQKSMNFTLQLQDPDPDYFGERSPNGTYNGAIGSIIRNEIDACFTGFFVKDYLAPEMDFSVAVYDDQLCIYVHKADRIPPSILPIFSVRSDLWLGFILTAFICAAVWCAFRSVNLCMSKNDLLASTRKSVKFQFIRILIDTWVVWVRVNVTRYPPFNSEKVFIVSLCLVSVIFGAIFESSLATVYIHPMYYKDIYTMKELDESGLKVIYKYSSMADDLFFSETSPLYASLNKKLIHLNDLNADVMLDVVQNGGKASVTRYTSLMLESFYFILSKKVWVIPECPKYYTISYVMPKDAPWEETINNLLLQFLNAGLIKKWIAEMQTSVDIKMMTAQAMDAEDTFKILTVRDLQLAFYVVFGGNIGAFVIHVGEIYLGKLLKKRNTKDAQGKSVEK